MYTRCTNCLSRFKVSAENLRAAQGMVRCGHCKEVFNAILHLADNQGEHHDESTASVEDSDFVTLTNSFNNSDIPSIDFEEQICETQSAEAGNEQTLPLALYEDHKKPVLDQALEITKSTWDKCQLGYDWICKQSIPLKTYYRKMTEDWVQKIMHAPKQLIAKRQQQTTALLFPKHSDKLSDEVNMVSDRKSRNRPNKTKDKQLRLDENLWQNSDLTHHDQTSSTTELDYSDTAQEIHFDLNQFSELDTSQDIQAQLVGAQDIDFNDEDIDVIISTLAFNTEHNADQGSDKLRQPKSDKKKSTTTKQVNEDTSSKIDSANQPGVVLEKLHTTVSAPKTQELPSNDELESLPATSEDEIDELDSEFTFLVDEKKLSEYNSTTDHEEPDFSENTCSTEKIPTEQEQIKVDEVDSFTEPQFEHDNVDEIDGSLSLKLNAKEFFEKAAANNKHDEIPEPDDHQNDTSSDNQFAQQDDLSGGQTVFEQIDEQISQPAVSELYSRNNNFDNTTTFVAADEPPNNVLLELYQNAQSTVVRAAAVRGISDTTFLKDIALEESNSVVRLVAVEKLDDTKLLHQIASSDSSEKIRNVAANRIKALESHLDS